MLPKTLKRIPFLYVILGVLLLASVAPLLLYALKMMDINSRALETNENLLQNTITRSITEEISIYNSTFHQLLDNLNRIVEVNTATGSRPPDYRNPQLRAMLEQFVSSSDYIIHVTDRKSTRLNSSHIQKSRMPSSA